MVDVDGLRGLIDDRIDRGYCGDDAVNEVVDSYRGFCYRLWSVCPDRDRYAVADAIVRVEWIRFRLMEEYFGIG